MTAADVTDGTVTNTATAQGRTPGDGPVTSPPDATTVPAGTTSPTPPAPPSPPDAPAPPEHLPTTGASVAMALLAAALLVAMGTGALFAGRTQRRR